MDELHDQPKLTVNQSVTSKRNAGAGFGMQKQLSTPKKPAGGSYDDDENLRAGPFDDDDLRQIPGK